jgi:hypothetical protein
MQARKTVKEKCSQIDIDLVMALSRPSRQQVTRAVTFSTA